MKKQKQCNLSKLLIPNYLIWIEVGAYVHQVVCVTCNFLLQETVLETEFDGEKSKFTMTQVGFGNHCMLLAGLLECTHTYLTSYLNYRFAVLVV